MDVLLKEITRLTCSNWLAVLVHSGGEWTVQSKFIQSPDRRKVHIFLRSQTVKKLASKALGHKAITQKEPDKNAGSRFLTLYQVNDASVLLVAYNDSAGHSKNLWKAIATNLSQQLASQEQTYLLHDTYQELENTQQELQARVAAQQAAESRLIQTTKLAAVGEMAAGVAHELNNPLTTVVGFSELILESLEADSSYYADMTVVLKEARRARDVVRRLLDFSRQSETIRVKADVNEIVQDVLSLMKHLFQLNGVDISLRLNPNLPWIMVDRNQMKQVYLNLFHNALNAMPNGGRLWIETGTATRYDKLHIVTSIRDSGVGIAPENLSRIFEPFFTTRADLGGTGLGLSVTYGIVTEHRGTIEVESEQGKGSRFSVFLPIENAQ